ncbi:MAG: transglycosylase SLT domain-containing protein [Candidatus Sulfobium sp.]|jgi:peptidoglycan lytic transglycosylase D
MKKFSCIIAVFVFLITSAVFASAGPTPQLDGFVNEGLKQIRAPLQTSDETGSPGITSYDDNKTAVRAVERNVSLFTTTIRDRFSMWLSRSGAYLDIMTRILKEKDVPEDIVFLSLIESGFNPYAYSMAHAAGPWQFIASTARRYGLKINWWRDERRDPVKSTEAAADYLKDLYSMFGSWNLALAAYNAGEGKILKAMKRGRVDDYWDLRETRHIRRETKNYVPKFIAARIIASNPEDFGFQNVDYKEPLRYDKVKLDSPVDLSVAAECAGTTLEEIRRLNPELRRWCTPPDVQEYTLRIPAGTKEHFLEKLSSLPDKDRFTMERYKVRRGDTLWRISRRIGVPMRIILSLNSMKKIMTLKQGSTLYLPPRGFSANDAEDRGMIRKVSYRKAAYRVKKKRSLKRRRRHHGRRT